jgi:hypothetical protein
MAYHRSGKPNKAKDHLRIAVASEVNFPGKDEAKKTMAGIN